MVDLKKLHWRVSELIVERNKNVMFVERARSLSEIQFSAWRKLYLAELGRKGLLADIDDLFYEIRLAAAMDEIEDAKEQESTE